MRSREGPSSGRGNAATLGSPKAAHHRSRSPARQARQPPHSRGWKSVSAAVKRDGATCRSGSQPAERRLKCASQEKRPCPTAAR
ncbi:hypothetical protein RC1_0111 [Rhodospirillum centenum SW]|uniref:Uncharacterized protein n=1 Tax=Rhodospirillum centenum (strain ATCC 51521 / SW) TaxID=414684 RepID=B6IQ24_RHOCS|nr:hypothetical protein RC1_0111 [Rhodospirillum centenum SW]